MLQKSCSFLLVILFVCVMNIYAARPLNTDDAKIVLKNSCQLETWVEFHSNSASEIWALPSCNLFWNTEITFGGMVGMKHNALQFQVKKLFVDADKKNWGIGIAFGNIHNYLIGSDNENDVYIYLPITVSFFDSKISLHANVGYNLQSFREGVYTVGLALEAMLFPSMYLLAETYYSRFSPVMYQVGLRTWLVQDILQIDTTYGNSFYGRMDFFSVGFRFLSPQFSKRQKRSKK